MKAKLVVLALALMAAATADDAFAQNINSDWSLGGGTGIGRHATGFSGTQGDPEYTGTSRPPTLRDYGPGSGYALFGAGVFGGLCYALAAPGYASPMRVRREYLSGLSVC